MTPLTVGSITFGVTYHPLTLNLTIEDIMKKETIEHFTELAINNAKCRRYSKWMYAENSKTQYFVTAVKKDGEIVVEYTQE